MHRPLNVGCALQAYATCRIFSNLGLSPQVIDYIYPNSNKIRIPLSKRLLTYANIFLGNVLTRGAFARRNRRFNDFIACNLPLTRKYNSYDELKNTPPSFDIYCTGSDQIWNPFFIQGDDSFLGSFVPKGGKLISFASSFGLDSFPMEYAEMFMKHFSRFSSISVRESDGCKILRNVFQIRATQVLDPTLVLNASDWDTLTLSPPPSTTGEGYILIYGIPFQDARMEKTAIVLAKQTGKKIIRIHGRPWNIFNTKMKYMFDIGPVEFLSYIKNADLILTSSFHGTAFSINFGRPFLSFASPMSSDTRIADLLKILALEKHLIDSAHPTLSSSVFDASDVKSSLGALNEMRKKSIRYLRLTIDL